MDVWLTDITSKEMQPFCKIAKSEGIYYNIQINTWLPEQQYAGTIINGTNLESKWKGSPSSTKYLKKVINKTTTFK